MIGVPMVSLRSRNAVRISALTALAVVAAGLAGPAAPAEGAARLLAPPAAPSEPKHQMTTTEALTQAWRTGRAVEVVGSTTETQTVTALPTGALRLTTSLVPVRKYVGGQWKGLDASLHRNSDGTLSPAVSTSELRLSGGGPGPLAVMTSAGETLGLTLPMALPVPTVSGAGATYAAVLPGWT